jgi:hypothetical protein
MQNGEAVAIGHYNRQDQLSQWLTAEAEGRTLQTGRPFWSHPSALGCAKKRIPICWDTVP